MNMTGEWPVFVGVWRAWLCSLRILTHPMDGEGVATAAAQRIQPPHNPRRPRLLHAPSTTRLAMKSQGTGSNGCAYNPPVI